jgi:hypothetical protein
MATQIKLRRDTAANWTLNGSVVLAAGEPGFETNTGKLKIGNGNDDWSTLSYVSGGVGDRLVNGLNEVILDASGALAYPNSALQRDTATVACAGNASTVVYTASGQYQHTIRLLIQVEGLLVRLWIWTHKHVK